MFRSVGLGLMIACTGCGPSYGDVRGTVTLNGKPVTKGIVIFLDETNLPYSGEIQPDGTYSIQKIPAGPVKVYAYTRPPSSATLRTRDPAAPAEKPGPDDIPAKYANPETSGLSTTIKSGSNEFNLALN